MLNDFIRYIHYHIYGYRNTYQKQFQYILINIIFNEHTYYETKPCVLFLIL